MCSSGGNHAHLQHAQQRGRHAHRVLVQQLLLEAEALAPTDGGAPSDPLLLAAAPILPVLGRAMLPGARDVLHVWRPEWRAFFEAQLFARDEALMYYTFLLLFCAVCCYYWRYGTPFVSGFYVGALGGALAGNMFTTKAVVEMLKCLATADPDDPCDQASCAYNPFFTAWPYLFILISLTLACVSLYLLAVGLQKFEALYMITVFEGFMIISGSISGNVVMNEKKGLPWWRVMGYCGAIFIILVGLYILCKGESAGREGSLLTRDMQPASDAEHLAQIEMAEDGAPSSIGRKGRGSSKSGSDSPHEKGALTSSNGNNE